MHPRVSVTAHVMAVRVMAVHVVTVRVTPVGVAPVRVTPCGRIAIVHGAVAVGLIAARLREAGRSNQAKRQRHSQIDRVFHQWTPHCRLPLPVREAVTRQVRGCTGRIGGKKVSKTQSSKAQLKPAQPTTEHGSSS
jgi:hypothetical protein